MVCGYGLGKQGCSIIQRKAGFVRIRSWQVASAMFCLYRFKRRARAMNIPGLDYCFITHIAVVFNLLYFKKKKVMFINVSGLFQTRTVYVGNAPGSVLYQKIYSN